MMLFPIFTTSFSHDWNTREGQKVGKLQCSYFTTLRLYSDKFREGSIHRVQNNDKSNAQKLGFTVVVKQLNFQYQDIEKWDVLCRLDTGYSAKETKDLLGKMYKTLTPETWLCFALMRYLTKKEVDLMNVKLNIESQPKIL